VSNVESRFLEFEGTEVREAEDGRRQITGIIMPWHGRYELKPGTFERFNRSAFDKSIAEHGDEISLFPQHNTTTHLPVGRAVSFENTNDGLVATFRMHKTRDAAEIIELAEGRDVTGLSVGFIPVRSRTDQEGENTIITRLEARLDHVGFVHRPAYKEAQVTAVRYDPDNPEVAPRLARWRGVWLA
jgi:HK97 family phage prohead protease